MSGYHVYNSPVLMRPSRRGLFGWFAALAVAPAAFASSRVPIPFVWGSMKRPIGSDVVWIDFSPVIIRPRSALYADEVLAAMRTFGFDNPQPKDTPDEA